jgi:hypothetical protein
VAAAWPVADVAGIDDDRAGDATLVSRRHDRRDPGVAADRACEARVGHQHGHPSSVSAAASAR